jgi:hypothetical protein
MARGLSSNKNRATRRGGRKGAPEGGRGFRPGARGDRATPKSRAEEGREVQQEVTEPRRDEGPRAPRRRKHGDE